MKKIKISRANFPGVGNFSWMNYFHNILKLKYDVEIDPINPDIIFYSNLYYSEGDMDYYTGGRVKGEHEYGNSVKKIYITGEVESNYVDRVERGNNYFALGYHHLDHPRYSRFPTYVLDAFVLHNEGGMFQDPFSWIIKEKNTDEILRSKKYYCSVVQASNNARRDKLFTLISKKHWIKSSGPWRPTVKDSEALNHHKYHNYSNKEYMGKIDGLVYRDKVNFFKDCYYNIAIQYTNTDYLIQEKIIHAFAANTIPIFYGNKYILKEEFNPEAFINLHQFSESFEDAVKYIDDVYHNYSKLRKYYSEPIFVNNTLPRYFSEEYVLNFLEKIINS